VTVHQGHGDDAHPVHRQYIPNPNIKIIRAHNQAKGPARGGGRPPFLPLRGQHLREHVHLIITRRREAIRNGQKSPSDLLARLIEDTPLDPGCPAGLARVWVRAGPPPLPLAHGVLRLLIHAADNAAIYLVAGWALSPVWRRRVQVADLARRHETTANVLQFLILNL